MGYKESHQAHLTQVHLTLVNPRGARDARPLIGPTSLFFMQFSSKVICQMIHAQNEQVAFQSNANHPLAESMGYIKFEGM